MVARGVTFLSLEDETGILNVVVSQGAWTRFLTIARNHPALVIRGSLQTASGVVNLVAEHMQPLPIATTVVSRDFR